MKKCVGGLKPTYSHAVFQVLWVVFSIYIWISANFTYKINILIYLHNFLWKVVDIKYLFAIIFIAKLQSSYSLKKEKEKGMTNTNTIKRLDAISHLIATASVANIKVHHLPNTLVLVLKNDDLITWKLTGLEYTDIACNPCNDSTLEDFIKMYANGDINKHSLANCCSSPRKIFGEYVKESYIDGRSKLAPIIKGHLMKCERASKIVDEVKSLTYNNTSARIHRGMYITPCMVDNIGV